jgi:serine protease Do
MRMEDRTRIQRRRRAALMFLSAASLFAVAQLGIAVDAQAFSAATVYRNTSSSVVLIFGFSDSGAGSSGTGSIMTRDGLILTNNHVITNPETGRLYSSLVVYFKPNPITGDNRKDLTTPFLVDVVARDTDLDLALLRVKDAPADLRPMKIADSEEVEIGEPVAAIGHPGGGGLWTLTTGTISSKRRDSARDVFQTDAAINPGNSGGPLLDEYSRLVGVNTFVRRVNEQGLPLEGLNYSLRSSLALAWINQQSVVNLSAVSRGSGTVGVPAPTTTPLAASGLVNRPSPQSASVTPRGAEPTDAPTIEPAMEPVVRVEPEPESKARAFEGPDGAKMYGVPNPTLDLHDALIQARKEYQALTERADESVDEMNRRLDDYDNF